MVIHYRQRTRLSWVLVGHRRFNAVAESGIVEAGERVKVIAVRERNLVVRVTDEPLSVTLNLSPAPTVKTDSSDSQEQKSNQNLLELSAEELGLDSIDE